ncbi:barstar family protein [Moraxella nasibovis]|uniref:barstar family protein n=1 Tax=Moraxella nasibovis TaxID=2904120 RepID=UPI00240FAB2B|nr:barstar family protein [Moraxella nasibovis]WFF39488.1 barstar family protein [Moraxella nasibovis]
MYLINFFTHTNDEIYSIKSNEIFCKQQQILQIKTKAKALQINLQAFDRVEIFVENYLRKLSKIFVSSFQKILINGDCIVITIDECLAFDEVFENNLFYYINTMITKQKFSWLNYSDKEKFLWLRSSYFYCRNHCHYNHFLEIDGKNIQTKNDFLCYFAESLIGIGAYFGSDLDGFDECFDIYKIKDIHLKWHNFECNDFCYKNDIVDILTSRNVKLTIG